MGILYGTSFIDEDPADFAQISFGCFLYGDLNFKFAETTSKTKMISCKIKK